MTLYVHIPFCLSKCPYCSFVSFPRRDSAVADYLKAVAREAAMYHGARVETVYIGGGTPTVLDHEEFSELADLVNEHFERIPGAEFTVEANPATFDEEKAGLMRAAGVNRVSLGVQSLNDDALRWLGRPHTAGQARAAFALLREAGFANINVDLMYGLPGQTEDDVRCEVDQLLSLGSEHVSLYLLSVEEGSALVGRGIVLPSADDQARLFTAVETSLRRRGFEHYEVSNFAKSGYACRHNTSYWRGGNYIGLGVAAHSHIDGHRYWNVADIPAYLSLMDQGTSARAGEERLEARMRFNETLLIGLRLTEGVDLPELALRFGTELPEKKRRLIEAMAAEGLLNTDGAHLAATPAGLLVLDEICRRLI